MMKRIMPSMSCLLLVFVLLGVVDDVVIRVRALPSGMRLEMVREHGPEDGVYGLHHTRLMLQRDVGRYGMISGRHLGGSSRRMAMEQDTESMQMPMTAGRDYQIGQYVARFKVGTPPKKFRLIVDLGSELTWVRCQYDRTRPRARRPGVFLPAYSSTFSIIPCSSSVCKVDLMNLFSLTQCPAPAAPCAYDFSYMDGSVAQGIFAKETVTADLADGREMKIDQVLVGCSEFIQGTGFEPVDGVLGMAYAERSFMAKAVPRFDGKFSYCLMDHLSHNNVSSYLTFGKSHNQSPLLARMRYTRLVTGGQISPLYGLDVFGISVGGKMMSVPNQVWDVNAGGGAVVDSGTSLTFLAEPAYDQVVGILKGSLSKYRKLKEDMSPLEYCFDSTGFDESSVPRLVIHFKDGARFEPPVKSYVIDVAPGIKCIGLLSVKMPGLTVIGNILQQNHLWEFDLAKNMLGFAPSSCT